MKIIKRGKGIKFPMICECWDCDTRVSIEILDLEINRNSYSTGVCYVCPNCKSRNPVDVDTITRKKVIEEMGNWFDRLWEWERA